MQTYQPEHYAIQAASRHDYSSFYKEELQQRRILGYPPFSRLIRLEIRSLKSQKAQEEAQKLAALIREKIFEKNLTQTELIGPQPCYYPRLHGFWRWQIVLSGPNPETLLPELPLKAWQVQVDPTSLL